MRKLLYVVASVALTFSVLPALSQTTAVAQDSSSTAVTGPAPANGALADGPARAELSRLPWEWGPFFQGGKGVGYIVTNYKLFSAGVRVGKVITDPHLGGIFRGQFEYAGEIMPYWQAYTPPQHEQQLSYTSDGTVYNFTALFGGGTFTGVSLTPIILRWDFTPHKRIAPWFQAAGGLIYTTHKFPPDVLVPHGDPGGTSVWNFSPQGGVGLQYFLSDHRSLMFSANAIHISSASLGDENPGVNASVQFQIGYTWWSGKR
jgi:lipid A 3-O-deacylase